MYSLGKTLLSFNKAEQGRTILKQALDPVIARFGLDNKITIEINDLLFKSGKVSHAKNPPASQPSVKECITLRGILNNDSSKNARKGPLKRNAKELWEFCKGSKKG